MTLRTRLLLGLALGVVGIAGVVGCGSDKASATAAAQQGAAPEGAAQQGAAQQGVAQRGSAEATARVGTVTAATGDVTVRTTADATPRPVTAGMIVTRDMTFRTGAGASVDVRFDNNYTWSLDEDSERAIASLAVIDRPPVPAVAADEQPAPSDDTDRTASAGRHAEASAAETPATATVKKPPKHAERPKPDTPDPTHSPVGNSTSGSCDEVACAIDPSIPCCKKKGGGSHRTADSGGSGSEDLPDSLTRDEIKTGIDQVRPRVMACFDKFKVAGTASVKITIGGDGRVRHAEVIGDFAGTPTGDCVESAVKTGRFPKWKGPSLSVKWPFVFK